MSKKPNRRELLKRNPQIQETRVAEYLEFARKMKERGFDLAPRYRVEPALGRIHTDLSDAQSAARDGKR